MSSKHHTDKSWISQFDIFYPSIKFTFKGQDKFKTGLGGVASVICYVIIVGVIILQTEELLLGHSEAFHFSSDAITDYDEVIDLKDLNFLFAVQKIDSTIARIEMSHITRDDDSCVQIPLVDC